LDLVTRRHTGSWLLLGGSWRSVLGLFFALFYAAFLASLKLGAGYAVAQACVIFAAVLREGELGALDVGVDVVVADLVALAEATDVVCDIRP
jgi:hypothetical protein